MDETRTNFMNELHTLLKKYDAYITCDAHWTGYPECGQDVRMTVDFNNYKIDSIDLGCCVDGESHKGA